MKLIYHPLFILLLLSIQFACAQQSDSEQELYPYTKEIQKFKKADSLAMPAQDAILFVGSSSIRKWKTLDRDMSPLKTINRGFGGSQLEHAIHFFSQIVTPYKPYAIVLYEGDNDIAGGKSPDSVFNDFLTFSQMVNDSLPGVPLFFISIKPSISREKVLPQMQLANALIRDYCSTQDGLYYMDVASGMMDDSGAIRKDIFVKDDLHMNAAGYKIWTGIIKPYLAKTLLLEAKN